jgi:hypothetical protein
MNAKEKAIELMDNFEDELMECDTYFLETAKQRCALIAVDEMINEFYTHPVAKMYWQEVKQEIEKL